MATFDFQTDTEYALTFKNGASVNILYGHIRSQGNIVVGYLFATEQNTEIQIDQSEICTVTKIPLEDVDKIKKMAQEQNRRWEQQLEDIGQADQSNGSYV